MVEGVQQGPVLVGTFYNERVIFSNHRGQSSGIPGDVRAICFCGVVSLVSGYGWVRPPENCKDVLAASSNPKTQSLLLGMF